jgi:hypothetical protein
MIDVHVNGRPLQPPATPLVERSRVLLPLRTVFTALGAAVRYDPRTGHIDVHRGLHFLRVTAGSRQAYVDNAPVTLDVPPLEHDGITYLPLRFVAESLGGHVRYLPQRNLIAIEDSQAPGSSPTRVLRHAAAFPPASAAAGGPPTVDYRHPAPGEFVTSAFPSISALIRTHAGTAATVSSLRFYLDGQDLTGALTVAPGAIAYTPANALAPGSHQVALRVLGARHAGNRAGRHAAIRFGHHRSGWRVRHALRIQPTVSAGGGQRRVSLSRDRRTADRLLRAALPRGRILRRQQRPDERLHAEHAGQHRHATQALERSSQRRERLGEIERAFVERASDDRLIHVRGRSRAQGAQVGDIPCTAARGKF